MVRSEAVWRQYVGMHGIWARLANRSLQMRLMVHANKQDAEHGHLCNNVPAQGALCVEGNGG